ncbi:DUF707 domain-containing protein [Pleomorphovibrio marinus]|uniref:DUF707 domain-containing protein n=1 Tax=Pleomorphovibrio marinus TaxID=2164132 RepID=UPI000E0C2C37|nr:DUF707 domain-containing protein [Pleomorphovibrio marinus]
MGLEKIINSENKFLLITTVGARSTATCLNWINSRESYDIILIYYDKNITKSYFYHDLADVVIFQEGYKYPTLYSFFKKYPKLLEKYEYFFLPDDDIEIFGSEIEILFSFAQEKSIALCQPSIQPINYTYNVTINNPYTFYRNVSMIEVMCPLFSKEALKICLKTFNESQSGWGLELAWAKLLNSNKYIFSILDKVIALHSKPINLYDGVLYKSLLKKKINPNVELKNMCEKYNTTINFVNISFYYILESHQKIYLFFDDLNKKIPDLSFKIIISIYLHVKTVKTLLKINKNTSQGILNFYGKNYRKDVNNEIYSFYYDNQKQFESILNEINVKNSHTIISKNIDFNKWDLLCNLFITEHCNDKIDYDNTYHLLETLSYLMKTHLNFSEYFEEILFYTLNKLSIRYIEDYLK